MKALFASFKRLPILRPDAAMVVLLVAILALMVLPMPTVLMDILIGTNLSLAAILLVVALHLSTPLKISAFPAILLVATLFRLALSIATTRLILLQGDAGAVVQTFGMFVVGGNIIVGLIVFLILTLVQFIVITKGSERVAEVSARFSLDGMPGKQMAIDGDLRANAITKEEAKSRRQQIELESQFYGAMDGAMKFVKGDAIAGLIIVVVNLLGGIGIAVLQKNMDMSEAIQTYSILTIGDGLVSQLPALLISIAAGLVVTRVSNEGGSESNIGSDIVRQVTRDPKALIFGGFIMGGMSALPGMPAAVFGTLAGVLIVSGGTVILRRRNQRKRGGPGVDGNGVRVQGEEGEVKPEGPGFAVPLMLCISPQARERYGMAALAKAVRTVRDAKTLELGIPFPEIVLRVDNALAEGSFTVYCSEVPVARWAQPPNHVLAWGVDHVRLVESHVAAEPCDFRKDMTSSYWISTQAADAARALGADVLADLEILDRFLGTILERHAAEFIGVHEASTLLTAIEKSVPDLVKEVDRHMPKQRVADVLQRLASEGVSIRNLKSILETLSKWGQKEKDPVVLTEYVRADLKRQIAYKYAQSADTLSAYMVSPALEDQLRNAVRQTSAGSYAVLDPVQTDRLLATVSEIASTLSDHVGPPVLLTAMDIRRYLRKLIERDFPQIPVLAYQELPPEVRVHALGHVDADL